MRALGLAAAVLAVVSGLLGCPRSRAPADTLPRSEWALRVDNHHWLDVTVSVIHDGQRTRLGTVTAATAHSFIVPPHLLGHSGSITPARRATFR